MAWSERVGRGVFEDEMALLLRDAVAVAVAVVGCGRHGEREREREKDRERKGGREEGGWGGRFNKVSGRHARTIGAREKREVGKAS